MNTIDKDSLEILIKNHGILLEHQTENKLSSYFRNKGDNVLLSNVSHRILSAAQNDYVELDVLTEIEKEYPRMKLKIRPRGKKQESEYDYRRLTVNITFLVQCKGHPSSGFLLCRFPKFQESNYYRETIIDVQNDQEIILSRRSIKVVDWAFFYKINEKQQIKNEQGKRGIVYQEDKDKFYKGMEQINDSISAYYNRYCQQRKNINFAKIIPLLVTNSPIYLMRINRSKVTFSEVPWVAQVNYYKPADIAMSDELYRNYFKFIFVVQYQELETFLNGILDIEDDLSYSSKYDKPFHTFNI